jgi:hypothetical protein
MLALALALSLSATPGAETRTYGARLVSDHARPIGQGTLIAQADLGAPQFDAYGQPMTLQALRAKYDELERSKPSIGGWIAMMSVGTPVCALFTFLTVALITTSGGGLGGFYSLFAIFTGALAFIGLALAVVGTILLIVMAVKRGRVSDEQDAVRRQIQQLETMPQPVPGYGPPPDPNFPPPPPPPPPSVERDTAVRPLLTLVAF